MYSLITIEIKIKWLEFDYQLKMSNSLLFRRAIYSTLRCERRRSASCHGRITSSAASLVSRTTNPWSSLSKCINIRLYSTQNERYWKPAVDKNKQSPASSFTLMSYNILAQHHIVGAIVYLFCRNFKLD